MECVCHCESRTFVDSAIATASLNAAPINALEYA